MHSVINSPELKQEDKTFWIKQRPQVFSLTFMCLYGGGFLSFFLSSWSCRSSFSACSSRNRTAASSKAEEGNQKSQNVVITMKNSKWLSISVSVKEATLLNPLGTFLVGGINTFPHLFFAVGVHIHIREDPGLVGPQVVVGAKKVNGKLPDIVSHPLDVLWDSFGMADLCWPPPLQSRRRKNTEGKDLSKSLQICVCVGCFETLDKSCETETVS